MRLLWCICGKTAYLLRGTRGGWCALWRNNLAELCSACGSGPVQRGEPAPPKPEYKMLRAVRRAVVLQLPQLFTVS